MAATDAHNGLDLHEFVEQRSSPAWRVLLLTITLLLAAFLSWMAWTEVEEVVRAHGQVEPQGRAKVINHPEGGRVAEIPVREGDRVASGDVLLRLDPALQEAERQNVEERLIKASIEAARLEAEADGRELMISLDLGKSRPDLVKSHQAMLTADREAYDSQRQTLADALAAREGEADAARANRIKLESSLKLLTEQVDAVRDLTERGFYPRLKLVELERELNETRGQLQAARADEAADSAALAEARSRLAELEKSHRSQLLADLEAAKSTRDALRHELAGQETRVDNLLVTAPTDGVVQELGVTAVGQAIAANEKIMKLVPIGEGLIVRAKVDNDDIGKVRLAMPATVKVHAYDFMRHGRLEGQVIEISADSRPINEEGALIYDVKVATEKDFLDDAPGELPVLPGMMVDVELKVGERTILSYLTDRIIEIKDEAFSEG